MAQALAQSNDMEHDPYVVQNFNFVRMLGSGTYGCVAAVTNRTLTEVPEGTPLAIKKMKKWNGGEGIESTTMREVNALMALRGHMNIVTLHKVGMDPSDPMATIVYLIFELCEAGDVGRLRTICAKENKINHPHWNPNKLLPMNTVPTLEQLARVMYQILNGIAYMHCKGLIHRDLKPQNILMTTDWIVKIADFGLARTVTIPNKLMSHEVATQWYRPPELFMGPANFKYTYALDIWSTGCIFIELTSGMPAFNAHTEFETLMKMLNTLGTPTNAIWPGSEAFTYADQFNRFPKFVRDPRDGITALLRRSHDSISQAAGYRPYGRTDIDRNSLAVDLFTRMLTYQPDRRITAVQALYHPFFDIVDKTQYQHFLGEVQANYPEGFPVMPPNPPFPQVDYGLPDNHDNDDMDVDDGPAPAAAAAAAAGGGGGGSRGRRGRRGPTQGNNQAAGGGGEGVGLRVSPRLREKRDKGQEPINYAHMSKGKKRDRDGRAK
ncbi:unnamed protein product [Vitrella brassicaformis CCMP3155]|uniref:Cyclin-dependent kinase 2 homolog n=1 Tax=Vitrella brassicaformis (strain CCMP3155) TaxID=1169540 RepID=A0A0G4G922_VITBC|nr:unnamed protein product [Vitrella brassicaformis CCMP3155]|eukprot:CEM25068.1 unnamed protein product [Vitrella brassicaformis CCMP3155]